MPGPGGPGSGRPVPGPGPSVPGRPVPGPASSGPALPGVGPSGVGPSGAGQSVPGPGSGAPVRPGPGAVQPPVAALAASVAALDQLADLPVAEHVSRYDALHGELSDALASIDGI